MDRNLKYLILECLADEEYFDLKSLTDIYRDEFDEQWDTMADYNYEPNPRIEEYYNRLKLEDFEIDKLESIVFSDPLDIHHNVWNQWDGECEYFDILSLEGIGVCKNLTELELLAMTDVEDLSPLSSLIKLKALTIDNNNFGEIKVMKGLETLLKLKELESVTIENIKVASTEQLAALVKELEGRGVDVNINLHE